MNDIDATIARLKERVTDEPIERPPLEIETTSRRLFVATGFPARYRDEWDRPVDAAWAERLEKMAASARIGGIIALVGTRGTGKTQIAAELVRDIDRANGRYMTAMGLFLDLRDSYRKTAKVSEREIVHGASRCPILVIDEVQERGGSEWEDRILTHIIDNRYGARKPTLLIANLRASEMAAQLGPSINDRIRESGGVIEMVGESWRARR